MRNSATAANIASASNHGASGETGAPTPTAVVATPSESDATIGGSTAASTLSDAGAQRRALRQGSAIRAANRRNATVRARSPASGTRTVTARTHPAPNVSSDAAGSPSLHRATTVPTNSAGSRSNPATTVAAPVSAVPPLPNAVTANAVSVVERFGLAVGREAGQETSAWPALAHALSSAVIASRMTRTLAPPTMAPRSASAAATGSPAGARTDATRAVDVAAAGSRDGSLGSDGTRTVLTVPGHRRRMRAVAASRPSFGKAEN